MVLFDGYLFSRRHASKSNRHSIKKEIIQKKFDFFEDSNFSILGNEMLQLGKIRNRHDRDSQVCAVIMVTMKTIGLKTDEMLALNDERFVGNINLY